MDAYQLKSGEMKDVVFISPEQAKAYGGYVGVAQAFPKAIVLPPVFLNEYFRELPDFNEVGHA